MATRWQQLGAFVAVGENLGDDQIAKFAQVGGRWVVVLLDQLGYPPDHDPTCAWNLGNIEALKGRFKYHGIACGAWFNGWAGGALGTTAAQDAQRVADIVKQHNLGPIMLDLEAAYQYPVGQPIQLPSLLVETRKRITTRSIGVSTNSPNDSMVWNGGPQYGHTKSMWHLAIRLCPQWYNAPAYGHGVWMRPDMTMAWLKQHGMEDNFCDPDAPAKRAVPLSYVHGTLEVTGLEGADLAGELAELEAAQHEYGYTTGFQTYTLERTPSDDFDLLAEAGRAGLFKV